MIKIRSKKLYSKKIWGKKVITSSELSKFLGVNWNTDKKYLLELVIDNQIKMEDVNLLK